MESVIGAIGPTLDEKASKYGDLDAPYVIAAWVMSAVATEESLAQALFGVDRARGGSLLLDGQPITIQSPRDAIRVFYGTGLDVVAIEDFVLRK